MSNLECVPQRSRSPTGRAGFPAGLGDNRSNFGLEVRVSLEGCRLRLLLSHRHFNGPLLVLVSRRAMDSTSVCPEVGCIPDRGLFPLVDARHCDNKIDNSEDVCQRLRMFLTL